MIKRPIVAIVLAACLAGSVTADADAQAPSSPRTPSFQPGLGDLMTAFIQRAISSSASAARRATGTTPPTNGAS
jgi:hypothetical protein